MKVVENRDLFQSLMGFWEETFAGGCPSIYPGMKDDFTAESTWVELQVPSCLEMPSSHVGLKSMRFLLDVHCFAKRGTDLKTMPLLVDATRDAVSRRVWAVRDFAEEAKPAVGYARMGDVEVRDLSRIEQRVLKSELQHVLVSARGIAQMMQ